MKREGLLIGLVLVSIAAPAQALTWQEVLDAVSKESYNFPHQATNKSVACTKHIRWEEYVEGSGRHKGYVRHQYKKMRIPCP